MGTRGASANPKQDTCKAGFHSSSGTNVRVIPVKPFQGGVDIDNIDNGPQFTEELQKPDDTNTGLKLQDLKNCPEVNVKKAGYSLLEDPGSPTEEFKKLSLQSSDKRGYKLCVESPERASKIKSPKDDRVIKPGVAEQSEQISSTTVLKSVENLPSSGAKNKFLRKNSGSNSLLHKFGTKKDLSESSVVTSAERTARSLPQPKSSNKGLALRPSTLFDNFVTVRSLKKTESLDSLVDSSDLTILSQVNWKCASTVLEQDLSEPPEDIMWAKPRDKHPATKNLRKPGPKKSGQPALGRTNNSRRQSRLLLPKEPVCDSDL